MPRQQHAPSAAPSSVVACLIVIATFALRAGPAAALALLVAVSPVLAQGAPESIPVPADLQMTLIFKVLGYDRNLEKRGWTALHIGIVFVGSDPASAKVRTDVTEALKRLSDKTLRKLPIDYAVVEYTSDSQFESAIKSNRFNMLYVAPGNARNLPKLLEVSQRERIITTTGVPDYVEKGVAVGIGVSQDKPRILINLRSSKLVGSEFDASLLQVARVVR